MYNTNNHNNRRCYGGFGPSVRTQSGHPWIDIIDRLVSSIAWAWFTWLVHALPQSNRERMTLCFATTAGRQVWQKGRQDRFDEHFLREECWHTDSSQPEETSGEVPIHLLERADRVSDEDSLHSIEWALEVIQLARARRDQTQPVA